MLIQTQAPTLRPQTTAHLAQTMTLLGLTAFELYQKIETELATNPALELIEDRFCPTCQRPLASSGPCPVCSQPRGILDSEPIVFISPREYFGNLSGNGSFQAEEREDDYTAEQDDLPTYVLRQVAPELEQEDHLLAVHILTSLDEDGLLKVPVIDIARFLHVPLSRIEDVIRKIQRVDPVGVGSRTPQEALLVQLEVLAESEHVPHLAFKAVEQGMDLLYHHQYDELARLLGVTPRKAKELAQFIGNNLNPYPARAHWGDVYHPTISDTGAYFHPDVIISRLNDDEDSPLVVEVISPLAGKLRINPMFREAVHQAPTEKTEQWQEHIDRASLLVKCLQQRNHTIVRLMQRIAQFQRKFILEGDSRLEPATRANLAVELGVHESTISRAVSNKTVQLPNGRIIPMSKFFDRSLHIRAEVLQIIAHENRPFTDTEIAKMLRVKGYKVARRTVAKYRSIEGIMPAHLRSKNNSNQVNKHPIQGGTSARQP